MENDPVILDKLEEAVGVPQEKRTKNKKKEAPELVSPPKRNKFGLVEGVEYKISEDKTKIDWRSMIPRQYLVPNRSNFEKRGIAVPETIDGLPDTDLLTILDGSKFLAELRGYESIEYEVQSSPGHCTAVCKIKWIGNFETFGESRVFSSIGDATPDSTRGFGQLFLGPCAENRAFVRNVRNFLRIPILAKEEIDGSQAPARNETAIASKKNGPNDLKKLMESKKVTFEIIKNKLIKENVPGSVDFNTVDDLPGALVFNMIERLQKMK